MGLSKRSRQIGHVVRLAVTEFAVAMVSLCSFSGSRILRIYNALLTDTMCRKTEVTEDANTREIVSLQKSSQNR